jgi:putative signal transducing protein
MRQVTWVSGSFAAHLLAARLRSEGIDVQLRGAVDGPYGLTVGDMARVDVWVPADQLDDASLVLLATEVDAALAAPSEWAHAGEESRPRRRWVLWVSVALLVSAGIVPLVVRVIDA